MSIRNTPQVLTGASMYNLYRLLLIHRIEKTFWWKLPSLMLWSTVLAPLYWLDKLLYFLIPKADLHPEPIFIIGHWRTGTTYLHYLLAKDKQFGYCSNADAFAPGALLLGRWFTRKVIALRLPKTRPMDEMKIHVDAPQEEEFAMMLLTPYSFYHGFAFPQTLKNLFFRFTLFNPNNFKVIDAWINSYYLYLRRLSHRHKGKRLLLKNPVNTARIKYLTVMFPNAKFIYLHRNPQEVKQSTLRMFQAMTTINKLQHLDEAQLVQEIELFHSTLLKEYETQRKLIDSSNLIEITYDDLVSDPLNTTKRIYNTLQIPGFKENQSFFEAFIEEEKNYKPHQYAHTTIKS